MQFGGERTPSFLSLDADQRVLRFDSFSKLLSSGIRVGFCTGPPPLVERIELHAQASVLHGSGVSQALVSGLFDAWAEEYPSAVAGFEAHCAAVASFYETRRDVFLRAAETHLAGLADWTVPTAGMFVWLELLGVADTHALITQHCAAAKVLLVPGQSFMPSDAPTSHVRAAFSTASDEEIDEALRRLAALLREQRRVQS